MHDVLDRISPLRLCRVAGKPTAREKWVAFHRLWRLACGPRRQSTLQAELCFQVLMHGWRWHQLLASPGDPLTMGLPVFLRRANLENAQYYRRESGVKRLLQAIMMEESHDVP